MERKDIQSIGDVLREVIEGNGMESRLQEIQAARVWPEVTGSYIASRTLDPLVRHGHMTVRVPDAALRQELSMYRSSLISAINGAVGADVIKSIRFTS